MKVVKPMRLSVVPRFFEHGAQPHLVVTAIGYFPLDAPEVLLGEQALWTDFGRDALRPVPTVEAPQNLAAAILDEGLPKARGEVLVRGNAYPPGGPAPGCAVRVTVGPKDAPLVDKKLYVSGDRYWDFMGMSMPKPFTEMPVDWEHAFGGPSHGWNPVGRGIVEVAGPEGKPVTPLPNVELEKDRVRARGDRPKPGGFAPVDHAHPLRMGKFGTFDKRWLDNEFPGMPSDMHLEAHNCAPEDQRIEGWFKGGEPFVIEHMHPTRPRLEGVLPSFRVRAFFTMKGDAAETLHEVGMRLETVQLVPHRNRGILVYRGVVKTVEDDGYDIVALMVGAEKLSVPRDHDHYRAVLKKRLDREEGAVEALRDIDLLPEIPRYVGDAGPIEDIQKLLARDGLMEANLERRAELDHARMKQEFEAAGLDPATFGMPTAPPTAVPPPSLALDDLGATIMQAEQREKDDSARVEKQRVEIEARGRALCEKHGVDYEKFTGAGVGGPPKFRAQHELEKLRASLARANEVGVTLPELEQRASDPEFEQRLRGQETQQLEMYRDGAHFMPAPAVIEDDYAKMLGARVSVANDAQVSLANEDLTGADLADAVIPGSDLSFTFLEAARLDRADLAGANFHRAVLTRASLRDANLSNADLRGANLGEADLTGTDLRGADLTGAVLFRTKLDRTKLGGAKLHDTDVWESELHDVSCVGASIRKVSFLRCTIERLDATDAELSDVTLLESRAPRLDLSRAKIEDLHLIAVDAPGASFRDASLVKMSALGECSLPDADFSGAKMPEASLRGANLAGANFEGAQLDGADLSECNLTGANLDRAILTGAAFIRADLANAKVRTSKLLDVVMHKAHLAGADFAGSNLFQADLTKAKGDDRTSFSGTNLGRAVHPRPRKPS